jgi:glycosyltransferase involved in cell wall biosynthesis
VTQARAPLVTVAIPSYNQAQYLEAALASVLAQDIPVEIFVADGGSTDGSVAILQRLAPRLAGWRSHPDRGQSAAINECIARGTAPFVCWLNSDDLLLPGALSTLHAALLAAPEAPAAYGRAWNRDEGSGRQTAVWVEPFSAPRLAQRCIIAQPATLMRRSAWDAVGGVDEALQMAMDYDLWWRLYRRFGPLAFVDAYVAVNRAHEDTKTRRNRRRHYREAMQIVRRHNGSVPLKWWLAQPYAVWYRSLFG